MAEGGHPTPSLLDLHTESRRNPQIEKSGHRSLFVARCARPSSQSTPLKRLVGLPGPRRAAAYLGLSLVLAAALGLRAGASGPFAAFSSPIRGGHMHPAVSPALPPQGTVLDKTGQFHCQQPSAKLHCYGPAQIRNAYAIQPLIDAGRDGSGEVITIIDAFQNPTMASDLTSFDS